MSEKTYVAHPVFDFDIPGQSQTTPKWDGWWDPGMVYTETMGQDGNGSEAEGLDSETDTDSSDTDTSSDSGNEPLGEMALLADIANARTIDDQAILLYAQVLHHPERHVTAALLSRELQHTTVGVPAQSIVTDAKQHRVVHLHPRELLKS